MDVTVSMTAEEFLEFVEWKKDHTHHKKEIDAQARKTELFAKKVCWAIEEDPKRPDKVKIIDQEHAAELLEMAKNYLA